VLVLGIKPQLLSSLASDIAPLLNPGALVISILAGTTTQTLSDAFPAARIVRLMPNLAAAIGKSPLGLFAPKATELVKSDIAAWLAPLGSVIWIDDEDHMDAVTALAGSGPAFIYRVIDALTKGGEAAGLPQVVAAQLALSMTEGAAILAATSPETPGDLAARVTSPGGTTAAGLAVLDADSALDRLMTQTLRAARDRGTELAKGDVT
jgi:pyrroline-5-carboxylate reductase